MLADLDRYREEQNQLELQQQGSVLYKTHIWSKYLSKIFIWEIRLQARPSDLDPTLYFDADRGISFEHTVLATQ